MEEDIIQKIIKDYQKQLEGKKIADKEKLETVLRKYIPTKETIRDKTGFEHYKNILEQPINYEKLNKTAKRLGNSENTIKMIKNVLTRNSLNTYGRFLMDRRIMEGEWLFNGLGATSQKIITEHLKEIKLDQLH